ncbi:HNH endonuclease [Escherichia coli]|nr:HNH endonuclease [Escherichia coli]EET9689111.1 HNH endonuclease [Escherichia coli]EFB2523165.1 HNH endonuclease [Escherichia coli]EFC4675382.1 HNH endonuclease [Escherichia coli]EFD5235574.1 HNH endonuclease [Escherichia coli]
MISFVFLLLVCPNCHAMLHRRKPPFTPEQLKALMDANKSN